MTALNPFSFDFRDRFVMVRGWTLAFRIFSEFNVYTPDPATMIVDELPEGITISADTFAWAGGQQTCPGSFVARICYHEEGFDCSITAKMSERIKGTAIYLRDVLPAEIMTADHRFESLVPGDNDLMEYPNEIKSPVFLLKHADGRYSGFANLDRMVRGKTVAIVPQGEHWLVELHHHEDARLWSETQQTPAWRIVNTADPEPLFKTRMQIAEDAWGLQAWEDRSDLPDWARQIGLVLNLHGMHWTGYLFNDYAEQLKSIRYVCQHIEGRYVLAYLSAWDGRYNYNWPGYEPDQRMGGVKGLTQLVNEAHALGVHVIPQIGAVSANRRYLPQSLHDCASQDAYGNTYVKQVCWDSDRQPDAYRVNANIGHPGFRQFLLDKTFGLKDRFGFDGIYLDINQMFHNDSRFSIVEGHLDFARRCQDRYDDFLILGEHWYDGILSAYPLVQSVYGQGKGYPAQWPQVFSKYARTSYHLIHPSPGTGSTGVYDAGFAKPWIPDPDIEAIPTISFVDNTQNRFTDEVKHRIGAARAFVKRKSLGAQRKVIYKPVM